MGGKIGTVRVIEGSERPCRWFPILFHPEGGHPEQGPLWLLDVRTGELRGPQKMPWPRVTGLSDGAMEKYRIAASRDGRLILYSYPWAADLDDDSGTAIVYDTVRQAVVAPPAAVGQRGVSGGFDPGTTPSS